jgi:hypothetical protein
MIADMKRVTRTYKISEDLVDALDEWRTSRRVAAQDAIELAVFLVMGLDSAQRDELFSLMDKRKPIQVEVREAGSGEDAGVAGQHSGAEPSKAKRRDAG